MAELSTERALPATPNRRQQARRRGHIPRSRSLISATVLLGALMLVSLFGDHFSARLSVLLRGHLSASPYMEMTTNSVVDNGRQWILGAAAIVFPMLLAIGLLAVLGNAAQGNLFWLPERVRPDVTRLDPRRHAGRLVSWARVLDGAWSMLRLGVVTAAGVWSAWSALLHPTKVMSSDPAVLTASFTHALIRIGLYVCAAWGVLAIVDYGIEWWRWERSIRLTPDELREETRSYEGDPQKRAHRRAFYQRLTPVEPTKTT